MKIKNSVMVLILTLIIMLLFSSGAGAVQIKKMTAEEIVEIELYENPSTGHRWKAEINNTAVISESGDEFKRLESEDGLVGRGGIHSWSFKAEKKGFSIVKFKLLAPEDQKVVQSISYLFAVDIAAAEVSVDEIMKISLAENPSTGYRWQLDLFENRILELLQQEYNSFANGSEIDNQNKEQPEKDETQLLVGQGGIKSWTFRGLKAGYQFLTFKLARSGGKEIKTVEYLILVE